MEKYEPKKIEEKWQKYWEKHPELCSAQDNSEKEKRYILDMFPYPSGEGLHVGHVESYTATDIVSRYLRMQGKNVLHPQGWDAFGLPAENYAIKTKVHPAETTKKSIATFKRQLNEMGFSYDWSLEVNSSNPEYYKWTQWFFLLLYKNGLAYKKLAKANWCPSCQTVLANEQVVSGECERCGTEVNQKDLEQWFFKITDFIEPSFAKTSDGQGQQKTSGLIDGLDKIDWPDSTKAAQKNWIGKSTGAQFKMSIVDSDLYIEVYTTRLDTAFGITYAVVAPEHEIISKLKPQISNLSEVEKYLGDAKKKTDLERMEAKEKTGVELKGIKVINPFNNEEVPLYVADYVLSHYGTGVVMAVPAHDERDYEFAKKYKLPIKKVIEPCFSQLTEPGKIKDHEPFEERDALAMVVKHWEKDEYIGLKWKKVAWQTLITGGVDSDKNPEEAARREILEETGYKNLKLIKELPMVHSKFYHVPKKVNRFAHFHVFYFELEDGGRQEISKEEQENHEVAWIPKEKMEQFFTAESHKYIWQTLDKPEITYTDDGVLNNSNEYNFLSSAEAREKMTVWLEKNKLGERKINYKIRDWLVSRQRYWGAPIPIIYCEECAKKFEYQENAAGVGVIMREKNGKYIFQKRDNNTEVSPGKIAPFGGAIENSEENSESLRRELKEEISLEFPEYQLKIIGDFKSQNFKGKSIKMYYLDNVDSSKITLNEGAGVYMATLEEVIENSQATEFTKEVMRYFKKHGFFSISEVNGKKCAAVPDNKLPVELPGDVDFNPTGESPLVNSKKFHDVKCPKCGGKARRESDTMDTFVCSSWYYFRYADPKNEKEFASKKQIKKWLPVDLYVGGAEHSVLHLLYSRFFTKVLHNLGYVDFDEPFLKLRHQGIILAEDGRKMSKSLGNVINPDDIVNKFGADSLRLFEMFMGPLEDMKPWNTRGIIGTQRFLEKIFRCHERLKDNFSEETDGLIEIVLNKTIKKITQDIEDLRFNTAISQMMIFLNMLSKNPEDLRGSKLESERKMGAMSDVIGMYAMISKEDFEKFLVILSPFAPHIAEELWERLGHKESIFLQSWPKYDTKLITDEEIDLVIQINGKLRDSVRVPADINEAEATTAGLQRDRIKAYLKDKKVVKVIFVKGRLINIVI